MKKQKELLCSQTRWILAGDSNRTAKRQCKYDYNFTLCRIRGTIKNIGREAKLLKIALIIKTNLLFDFAFNFRNVFIVSREE